MRKNDTINCYVSGVNKLPVRENPFADTDTDDSAADSTRDITPSAAYVRPRYGAYIAAAVLAVCVGVGAVFALQHIRKDDTPADSISMSSVSETKSYPAADDSMISNAEIALQTTFTNAETALENYREAEKGSHYLLKYYDNFLTSGQDNEDVRTWIYANLYPYAELCQKAVKYLAENSTGAGYYLLDVIKYEGEDTLSLSFINKTGEPIVLTGSGTAYRNGTGEKLCDLTVSEITLPPDELSQIKLDTGGNSLNDFNIALNTENGTDISLSIDPADIIETLSRERISELTRKLNE